MAPQILESTTDRPLQVRKRRDDEERGYFNPVDLVCYLKRADGSRYDLREYVGPATEASYPRSLRRTRRIRALELPGLWNGAMSDWNTVFVEVPASTFSNPAVKTVNDLLRPAHQ